MFDYDSFWPCLLIYLGLWAAAIAFVLVIRCELLVDFLWGLLDRIDHIFELLRKRRR